MIIRVAVANITRDEFAQVAQAAGLSGSVASNTGFGAWGIEAGIMAEFATLEDETAIRAFVVGLLAKRNEQAAYVTLTGRTTLTRAYLWNADGTSDLIG